MSLHRIPRPNFSPSLKERRCTTCGRFAHPHLAGTVPAEEVDSYTTTCWDHRPPTPAWYEALMEGLMRNIGRQERLQLR